MRMLPFDHRVFITLFTASLLACSSSGNSETQDTIGTDSSLVFPDADGNPQPADSSAPDTKDASVTDLLHQDQGDTQTLDQLDLTPSDVPPQELTDESSDMGGPDYDGPDLTEDQTPTDQIDPDLPPTDVITGPPPLFDLPLIQDASTAHCTFENPHTVFKDGVMLDAWHVTYTSFEAQNGVLVPIQIQGFAAKPAGQGGPMPGLVQAHGLGGYCEEDHATGLSALTGMFVIVYTGPGGGTEPTNTSEGTPSSAMDGYHMFDVLQDPRQTWFWGHTVAAMRGITCLQTRPEVNPAHIGMTGFSAGGVATLLVAGADPRLKAGVPLSGTLAWDVAAKSPNAWQNQLLTLAGLTAASSEWTVLMQKLISPQALLATTSAALFMVNGTTDEFFPLTAHMATYNVLGEPKRTSFAANFDHGCYQLSGLETPATIEARASLRAKGAQRAWFRHHFQTDSNYAYIPSTPQLQASNLGGATYLTAIVDGGGSALDVDTVHVWWSGDDCWSFISQELESKGNGLYDALVPMVLPPNSVYYVDVVYKTSGLFAERFSVSSAPVIPDGLVPAIRNMTTCM